MLELSQYAQAALILHSAKKFVSCRCDGSWWVLDDLLWQHIASLRGGPEHAFVLAIFRAERRRRWDDAA